MDVKASKAVELLSIAEYLISMIYKTNWYCKQNKKE